MLLSKDGVINSLIFICKKYKFVAKNSFLLLENDKRGLYALRSYALKIEWTVSRQNRQRKITYSQFSSIFNQYYLKCFSSCKDIS